MLKLEIEREREPYTTLRKVISRFQLPKASFVPIYVVHKLRRLTDT